MIFLTLMRSLYYNGGKGQRWSFLKKYAIKSLAGALLGQRDKRGSDMLMWMTEDFYDRGKRRRPEELEEWIFRIAQRDGGAFHIFYEETKTAVYGFALSIVKNPQEAEDIMQETYLSVYRSAVSYQPQGKPMAWVMRIARNFAYLQLRDKKKHRVLSLDEMEQWMGTQYQLEHEDKLLLEMAMKALTDEERQIVSLHALAGLKHREIAEMLNLKLATVLSKYHRALKKLQETIKEA